MLLARFATWKERLVRVGELMHLIEERLLVVRRGYMRRVNTMKGRNEGNYLFGYLVGIQKEATTEPKSAMLPTVNEKKSGGRGCMGTQLVATGYRWRQRIVASIANRTVVSECLVCLGV